MNGPTLFTTSGYADLYAITSTGIAAPMTEGLNSFYSVLAADWVAAGLPAGIYEGAILHGHWAIPDTTNDIQEGTFSDFRFDGTSTVDSLGDLADAISNISGGVIVPVNQVPCPAGRTWNLKSRGAGLVGEIPLYATVGETNIYAMSFAADLPTNGRLVSLDEIAVVSGSEDGIAFSEDDEDFGVDRGEAKFGFTCVTAGTYEISVAVTYGEGTGGGTATGVVTLIVRDAS